MLLSRDYESFISNQILYIAVGYLGLFGILGYSVMAQPPTVSVSWKPPSGNIEPVVTVSCMAYDLPSGHTKLTYQWEITNGIVLSNNGALVDADPTRFSVKDDGKELFIRNAVKVDEGSYTCRVFYRLGQLTILYNEVFVPITTYLPPLNYPQCSISPDTGVTVGSEINLICESGISLSSLSMTMVTLLIHMPDETYTYSSPGMVTWTVREEDDMAQFTCTMESSTFPTALRTCSATIFNATNTPPTPKIPISSIPDESHTTSTIIQGTKEHDFITSEEMIKAYTSTAPTGSGSGRSGPKKLSGEVVTGAAGGLLVLLVIVGIIFVVIIFIRRKSEEKPAFSPPSNGTRDTGDLRVDFSKAGNIYSEETICNNALLSDRPSTSNRHPPNQPRPVSVVYGVVDKTKSNGTSGAVRSSNSTPNNPKNNGDAAYECADLDKRPPIKSTAADAAVGAELPVYGKVNKGYKTDKKDDGQNKRESSGFVENIIYEPTQI